MGTNTHPRRILASALLVAGVMFLSFAYSAPQAEESVTVDFGSAMGYAGDPIATGFRGGTWADAIPDSLITPLKPSLVGFPKKLQGEPDDSVWVRAAATGATMGVAIYEHFGFNTRGHWQPPGTYEEKMLLWKAHVAAMVDSVQSHRQVGSATVPIHYDIWNEPDLKDNWHPDAYYGDPLALFYDVWREAVGVILDVDSVGLALGHASITGPSFAGGPIGFDSTLVDGNGVRQDSGVRLEGLLTYWEVHHCWPDILAWHHIGFSDFRALDNETDPKVMNILGQVRYAKERVNAHGGDSSAVRYEINEMLGWDVYMIPGVLVRNFALAERAKAEGLLSVARTHWCQEPTQPLCGEIENRFDPDNPNWCYGCDPGNGFPWALQGTRLSGLVVPYGLDLWKKRYGWWLYKAYADLDGEYVTVTPSGTGFDGLASRDDASQTARVLLGRYQAPTPTVRDSVTVILENLDAVPGMVKDGIVQVEVRRFLGSFDDAWTGGISDGDLLVPSFGRRYPVGLDNTLSLTLGGEAAFDTLDAVSIVLSAPVFVSRTAAQ